MNDVRQARRNFLRLLLGSPLLLSTEVRALERVLADPGAVAALDPALSDHVITRPSDAVNVFDLRALAEDRLSPAHYAYLSLGVDHEVTLRANRAGFEKFLFRPRRLVDTRDVDTKIELLGTKLSSPILLSPCSSQRTFHPEAELATARAARKQDHLMILSASASMEFEDVARARRGPLWYQLPYPTRIWMATRSALKDAEDAGCPAVVLTVDMVGLGENRDRLSHFHRDDNPECDSCHNGVLARTMRSLGSAASSIGFAPLDMASYVMDVDWDIVARIREATKLKLVIKGILTHEDARLCVQNGVDAIIVSNHGGRSVDSGMSTIDALPEIVEAVGGRIPVLIDSGFRRGTDIVKALALGASAVCVGRPYLWGLSAFGQDGVEAALGMLQRELIMAMKAVGTPNLASITPQHVQRVNSVCSPDGTHGSWPSSGRLFDQSSSRLCTSRVWSCLG